MKDDSGVLRLLRTFCKQLWQHSHCQLVLTGTEQGVGLRQQSVATTNFDDDLSINITEIHFTSRDLMKASIPMKGLEKPLNGFMGSLMTAIWPAQLKLSKTSSLRKNHRRQFLNVFHPGSI